MPKRKYIPTDIKAIVFNRDNGKCRKCGASGQIELNNHHRNMVVDGGTSEPDNLVLLCSRCHDEWHWIHNRLPQFTFEKWLKAPPIDMLLMPYWNDAIEQSVEEGGLSDFGKALALFVGVMKNSDFG